MNEKSIEQHEFRIKRANKIKTAFHLIMSIKNRTLFECECVCVPCAKSDFVPSLFFVSAFHRIFNKFHKMSFLCQVKRFTFFIFVSLYADFVNLFSSTDHFLPFSWLKTRFFFLHVVKFIYNGLVRLLCHSCLKCNKIRFTPFSLCTVIRIELEVKGRSITADQHFDIIKLIGFVIISLWNAFPHYGYGIAKKYTCK